MSISTDDLVPGALAALDCRVVEAYDAGDHVIYLGRVEAVRRRDDAEPLPYFCGGYGELASSSGG